MNVHELTIRKWLSELRYYAKVRRPIDEEVENEILRKEKERKLAQGNVRSKKWYLKNRERQLEYYRQWHKRNKEKLCKKKKVNVLKLQKSPVQKDGI
jgi:hypothetical protein